MIQRILIIMQIWLVSTLAMGQSESKTINSIKRDQSYLYEEATAKDAGEAYQLAYELLKQRIKEYITEEKNSSTTIESAIQQIQMRRGDLTRVFLYVKKENIKRETQEETKEAEVKENTSNGDYALKLPVSWQQAIIDELLKCETIAEAKALLSRQKAEFKVKRYGSFATCSDKSTCFWIVSDTNGNLLTVLGPGIDTRTDFRTLSKKSVTLNNNSIWFTIAK